MKKYLPNFGIIMFVIISLIAYLSQGMPGLMLFTKVMGTLVFVFVSMGVIVWVGNWYENYRKNG